MLIRPEVQSLLRYSPGAKAGEELRRLGLEKVAKLNSNEAPWEPFPEAVEAMQRALTRLNRYPDQSYCELREAIGEQYGVPAAQIAVGGGSGSLIKLLALVVLRGGDEVLIPYPPYPAHVVSAGIMGATVVRVPLADGACDLEALLELVTPQTRLAFICSPHNPSGGVVKRRDFEAYLERVPEHVLTVLDQAYQEFATDSQAVDGSVYLEAGKPLVVLRTFSKVYGLAGLRVGYGLSTPELSDAMRKAGETFAVSQLGVEAALASLRRPDLVRERVRANAEERQKLHQACDALGLEHTPSEGNFIFVDVRRDAKAVASALLRRGVMVRSGEVHDAPTSIRVTVGSPEENDAFLAALREVLAEVPTAEPSLA
jgi:histidinol-phosphate aminotransferase